MRLPYLKLITFKIKLVNFFKLQDLPYHPFKATRSLISPFSNYNIGHM